LETTQALDWIEPQVFANVLKKGPQEVARCMVTVPSASFATMALVIFSQVSSSTDESVKARLWGSSARAGSINSAMSYTPMPRNGSMNSHCGEEEPPCSRPRWIE
jgi:hypothetical protein